MRRLWPRTARNPASLRSSPAYARTVFGLRLASSCSHPRYSSDAALKSSAMARPPAIVRETAANRDPISDLDTRSLTGQCRGRLDLVVWRPERQEGPVDAAVGPRPHTGLDVVGPGPCVDRQ